MKSTLNILFLFIIGSMIGYILEVLFRRFVSAKKWINPGFLIGPYIPLYGFGLVIFYSLCKIDLTFITNEKLRTFVLVLIMALFATLLEYIIGIVSLKVTKVRLWDYSNQFLNIQGIICPLFTMFWGIIGLLYYAFINPYISSLIDWLDNNIIYSFFIGLFYGIFIIDLCYSLKIVTRIRKFAKDNDLTIKYENFKVIIKSEMEKKKEKYSFFFPFRSNNFKEHLMKYKEEAQKLKVIIENEYKL